MDPVRSLSPPPRQEHQNEAEHATGGGADRPAVDLAAAFPRPGNSSSRATSLGLTTSWRWRSRVPTFASLRTAQGVRGVAEVGPHVSAAGRLTGTARHGIRRLTCGDGIGRPHASSAGCGSDVLIIPRSRVRALPAPPVDLRFYLRSAWIVSEMSLGGPGWARPWCCADAHPPLDSRP